ncbi:HIT family protein [Candidatus Woesearchaeota archaeon]|nr:HIT family protein [Candidatus Woesearchaeota archaeon]
MEDCIFCKIVKGDIPCSKVYEDENVLSFLDISPANKGHTLVIPKKHYEKFNEMPEDEASTLMSAANKVSKAVEKAIEPEGYSILINNGKAAGQEVGHVHLHIMPKYEKDDFKLLWTHSNYEEGEMGKVLEKIKTFL